MDVSKYPSWDKTQEYKKYDVVNYQGALFAALVDVPAEAPIDDTSKWLMIFKNQAFTNHERFQMLMIEKASGEGGTGGGGDSVQVVGWTQSYSGGVDVEPQGKFSFSVKAGTLPANGEVLGILDYRVNDGSSEQVPLVLIDSWVRVDKQTMDVTFFNPMLVNLYPYTFWFAFLVKVAGGGGGGGEISTLQQIFAKYKNDGLNIQTADDVEPNLMIRGNIGRNSLSPSAIEISGDEYFKVRTTGDSDFYLEISDGILAVLKKRLGMYTIKRAEYDNWSINANSRGSITIPVVNGTSNDEIIAYRVIDLQEATQGGANRDGCVLQFFQTANNRKSAQIAVRNVSSENAKIKVIVECLVGTVV